MKNKSLISIILLAILLIPITSMNADERIAFNSWSSGGKHFRNVINLSDLKKIPSWSPVDGPPPVSQHHAVKIARSYIKKKNPNFIDAKIASIKLNQFLLPKYYKNKWFYSIILMKGIPENTKSIDHLSIVIMLDGSINEAESY